ncbi:flagellar hook-length control protein FliK [Maricurvus nonylphenolicus]|uniref:flagellar hook-length control protein FliK n=1 Tax=Maricurvus nonylphenolicus TaxID=1008307 RepID=UPI0036F3AEE2
MNSNNALTQPRAALDSLLNINTSAPSRAPESVAENTDKKPFDAHMADQTERKPVDKELAHEEDDQHVADKPAPEHNQQKAPESEPKSAEAAENPATESSEPEESAKEAVAGEASQSATAPAETVPAQQAAKAAAVPTEPSVVVTETATEKPATTSVNEGVNSVPLNGGILANNRQSDAATLVGTEAEGLTVSGKPLPSVTAPAAVDATTVVQASSLPTTAANGAQANVISTPAQQNPVAGIGGLNEDTPLSQVSTELGIDAVGAKESSRPALAVATQLSMAAAKTSTVSETTLLAQAVNNAVDKVAVAANVVEKADQNLIKPTAAPRLIAPAVAKYQLDGQPSVSQTRVNVPVGQPQWPSAVAERVMWMSSQRVTSAEIHLDPPELGPLQVRVSVNQEAASVTFTSQHAAVREALDLGAFRLREMFEAEGMDLVNVDVSDQSLAQGSEDGEAGGSGQGGSGSGTEDAEDVAAVTAISSHDGLVDHYV